MKTTRRHILWFSALVPLLSQRASFVAPAKGFTMPEHKGTLTSMDNLAIVLSREGRNAEAEKLEREALNISRRALGPQHPQTAASTYNLGVIAGNRGNRTEAFSLLREALDHGLLPTAALGMEKDPGLKSLQGDPHFEALVVYAKQRAAATRTSE